MRVRYGGWDSVKVRDGAGDWLRFKVGGKE